jgi:hypothetical protein
MVLTGEGGFTVVKWVKGEFSNNGTGRNISRGDHSSRSIWSHDTRLTLFVTGGGCRYFHDLFGKPLKYPISGPYKGVYGLVTGVGYI